jgi:hypothetical protein
MFRKSGCLLERRDDTRLLFLGDDSWDPEPNVGVAGLCTDDARERGGDMEDTVLARLLAPMEVGDMDLRCDGRSMIDGLP